MTLYEYSCYTELMKKTTACLLIISLLTLNLVTGALAQNGTSESEDPIMRAQEDYLFQYADYNEKHEIYLTKKEANEQFRTITSEQEAIVAAKAVLVQRAEVLRTYLQLLKLKILAQGKLDPGMKESQVGKIEATQAFLTTHKFSIESFRSIAGLNSESKRLEREAAAIFSLSYESLSIILMGQIQGLEYRSGVLLDKIISQKNLADNESLQYGVNEVRRRLTSVRVSIDRASEMVQSIRASRRSDAEDTYKQVKKEMSQAKATLADAVGYIQNIERIISNE